MNMWLDACNGAFAALWDARQAIVTLLESCVTTRADRQ